MEEKRRIAQELNLARSLQLLAIAHEEVSTMKMKLARSSVLANREFFSALSEVFVNVRSAYKKHIISQMKKERQKTQPKLFSTLTTNGKEILVFLAANNKLYGDIIPKVFALFKQNYDKPNTDLAIIGKLGKELYEQAGLQRPYFYFEIEDSEKSTEDLRKLIRKILEYETVTIFYGKFINVINQIPVASNISGDQPFEKGLEKSFEDTKEYSFFFEPSIEKILNYFETQIFFLLFNQTVHEAALGRYASRITAMETALKSITKKIDLLTLAEKRAKNLLMNKKQLERIAGMRLWQ